MRVLVANKFWYLRGGLERVMFDEIAMLEAAGHEVAHFSAAHPSNDPSPWQEGFVPYLELGHGGTLSVMDRVLATKRLLSNGEAARRFARVADEFRPDVVHCHGIHRQLSPSILEVCGQRNLPVVQTLHDYHHVCPCDVLLRGGVEPCEPRRCGKYDYSGSIRYRCVRGSLAASALSAAETAFQRVRGVYERSVSCFICPSRFLADAMRDGGWKVSSRVVPNAVPTRPDSASRGDYFLLAGRLSREKGVAVALEASRIAGTRIVVAGEGPEEVALRSAYPEVEFVGRLGSAAVGGLLARARAAVVPSIWFENAPMSVLEPMAQGVPVVASRIGGIPEMIEHDVQGLLVPPGDVEAFAAALKKLATDAAACERMGRAGRERVAEEFSPDRHLHGILAAYQVAIEHRRTS